MDSLFAIFYIFILPSIRVFCKSFQSWKTEKKKKRKWSETKSFKLPTLDTLQSCLAAIKYETTLILRIRILELVDIEEFILVTSSPLVQHRLFK